MWNYKIAMATFRTSQRQDGDEVLKCCEWRCQGTKRRFRKPEHTKEHIKKDSNTYFVKKFLGALDVPKTLDYFQQQRITKMKWLVCSAKWIAPDHYSNLYIR